MTEVPVDLAAPPAQLRAFPAVSPGRQPAQLFRITFDRDRDTGELAPPWRFASAPPGRNRFDVPEPLGSCYWSDRRYGAVLEVFRRTLVVDRVDATRRRLFVAAPPPLHLADTLARAAVRFGVTAELSTLSDYRLPQAWAAALLHAGFHGLVAFCRHDPSARARTVAVFGPHGTPARQLGWRTVRTRIETDVPLAAELAELGITLAPVPFSVPTVPAP